MTSYVPAYYPPCDSYWNLILDEGPITQSPGSGLWEWIEAPAVPSEIWEEARELQRKHQTLELKIDGYNRGGLMAHWQKIECFIPASHLVNYPFPADPVLREGIFDNYIGQILRLCIIEVEPPRNRILLSERKVADCSKETPDWPNWLCIGTTRPGVVTSVRPFGAFVDIGPLEGMVHISEISWGRVRHPEDYLEVGQEVRVKILNVDLDHQRVGLSLKRLTENPWDTVVRRFAAGQQITGTIAGIERFGVFVELQDGIEGLLHISEMHPYASSDSLYERYDVGDPIDVRILEIIAREHRIALGLPLEVGDHVTA